MISHYIISGSIFLKIKMDKFISYIIYRGLPIDWLFLETC